MGEGLRAVAWVERDGDWRRLIRIGRFGSRFDIGNHVQTGEILAHRGIPRGAENSLAAIERTLAAGFGVEIDVRLAQDGVPVLTHDADYLGVWGVEASVAVTPHDRRPPGVATLDSALVAAAETTGTIALHIKQATEECIRTTVQALARTGVGRRAFLFDLPLSLAIYAKSIDPTVRVAVVANDALPLSAMDKGWPFDAVWIDEVGRALSSSTSVAEVQDWGWPCYAVSPELHGRFDRLTEAWRQYADHGLSGICTDRCDAARGEFPA